MNLGQINLDALSPEEQRRLKELAEALEKRKKYEKLLHLDLYPWQKKLAAASNGNSQVMACCANQIGKSYSGAAITAMHLTGRYPDDWEGHKFDKPIYAWAAGVSSETTRDIVQSELFGESSDPEALGTGMVPKEDIGTITKRRGASGNTYDSVLVKHYTDGVFDGYSRIGFKSYEMGEAKFFGRSLDWIWLDEQPPSDIYTQCITRTVATSGKVMMTFTPEDGLTPVVKDFFYNRQPGQALVRATWDDAPHLDEATKQQLLSQYPPHEREMRAKGVPFFGDGQVFPVPEEDIRIEPFEVPSHWLAIAGLDFGWDHPTAVAWVRYDPDSDIVYVVDEYRKKQQTPMVHAVAINARPKCPVAWPHDGNQHDKGSGEQLADQYRKHGVDMLPTHFTNSPVPGQIKGDNRIEPGISLMLERMQTGRFKVFSTCREWFEEFSTYSRKDGKIVALDDDLMSATRYAVCSLRFAQKPRHHEIWDNNPQVDTSWIT